MNYFGTFVSLLALSFLTNTVVEARLILLRLSRWQNRPPTYQQGDRSSDTRVHRLVLRTNHATSAHLWLQNKVHFKQTTINSPRYDSYKRARLWLRNQVQFKQATIDSIRYDRYTRDHLWLQKVQVRPSAASPPASEGETMPITPEPRVSQYQLYLPRSS